MRVGGGKISCLAWPYQARLIPISSCSLLIRLPNSFFSSKQRLLRDRWDLKTIFRKVILEKQKPWNTSNSALQLRTLPSWRTPCGPFSSPPLPQTSFWPGHFQGRLRWCPFLHRISNLRCYLLTVFTWRTGFLRGSEHVWNIYCVARRCAPFFIYVQSIR